MTPTLDHVFICPEDAATAESALAGFGLQCGRRGVHRGQGTANACVFFDNAYLELLWRHDDDELQSETVRAVALWERVRWRETGASPFGIALRPGVDRIPVETWAYEAPFLPAGSTIPIVTPPFTPREPLVFLSLVSEPPAMLPFEQRPLPEQRSARRTLTGVTVCGTDVSRLSPGLRALRELSVFRTRDAAEPLLELDWDGAHSNAFHDFRPALPLVLRW